MEYIKAFFEASVEVKFYNEERKGNNYIIKNTSDVPFKLSEKRGPTFIIPANGETIVMLPRDVSNSFAVKNSNTKGTDNLTVSLDFKK